MRKLLLLCLSFALTTIVWAQDRIVTGNVTSIEEATGLPGVNVLIQGTTQGTTTDVDGNYSVNVPADGTNLVFSFVGYRSQVDQLLTFSWKKTFQPWKKWWLLLLGWKGKRSR